MRTLTIGLTGGIGSGKSTVSRLFTELGITVVDADLIARQLVMPNTQALNRISDHFGDGILLSDGTLNRVKLRNIIFDNNNHRLWLNQLLHPIIRNEIIQQLERSDSKYLVLDAPLLIENKLSNEVNLVAVIDCTLEQQLKRAMGRDNRNEQEIRAIIKTQVTREQRLKSADIVIDNSGSLSQLTQQINRLHQTFLEKAKRMPTG